MVNRGCGAKVAVTSVLRPFSNASRFPLSLKKTNFEAHCERRTCKTIWRGIVRHGKHVGNVQAAELSGRVSNFNSLLADLRLHSGDQEPPATGDASSRVRIRRLIYSILSDYTKSEITQT